MSDASHAEQRSDNLYDFGYFPSLIPWYQVLFETGIIGMIPAFELPRIWAKRR